ncbi:hypothetical protein HTL2_003501 [Paenibacillus melissococcoides]|nr:hypothetical protein HTL2_003501 [Paenibacillus melissococcoides]
MRALTHADIGTSAVKPILHNRCRANARLTLKEESRWNMEEKSGMFACLP